MNKSKKFLLFFFIVFSGTAYAQDTIRVMHYNMLYYGKNIFGCNDTTNSIASKDSCLKKIVKFVKPDILTANEMSPQDSMHQRILDRVLNTEGITHFKRGALTNLSNDISVNDVFYNSDKLEILSQHSIPTLYRDINIYNFYYKSWDLESTNDTAFLTCIVVHLKAGSTPSDSLKRIEQTTILMAYLDSLNIKANYLLSGDFNVYTGDEQCFQNLVNDINAGIRFYDPVNMVRDWHADITYSNYHTQSTHRTGNGCHTSGGLDDRFDFILQSKYIKDGTDHMKYINGSYKAIGQDGNHFNLAVNEGTTNTSAPAEVTNALYLMSDHLPVSMDLLIDQKHVNTEIPEVLFPNPVTDMLYLSINSDSVSKLEFSIINILAQTVYSCSRETSGTYDTFGFPVDFLSQGVYILRISDGKNKPVGRKFFKR
ncbi:MAG TPA: T9SS type A sorting domain-containing protein [Bacteroidales bacterium]|nr:T9SS type A sorting domain-containing protein [Bacteroidales bacterium]